CIECRARKAKCTKTRPSCAHCRQLNKPCVYPDKVVRSPLTRRHLTAVEDRLETLETALSKLFPGGALDSIIKSLLNDSADLHVLPGTPSTEFTSVSDLPLDLEIPDAPPLSSIQEGLLRFGVVDRIDLSLATFPDGPTNLVLDASIPLDDTLLPIPQPGGVETLVPDEARLVRAYFEHYHPLFPFVHQSTFLKQYEHQLDTAQDVGWLVLRDMILAMGSWSLQDAGDWYHSHSFSQRAKSRLDCFSIFDQASLSLIQALLLMSDYYQRYGQPKDGWTCLGVATRTAVNLGLHQESTASGSEDTLLAHEIRRRVWWSVYCLDSCASKIFGLPLLLPDDRLITVKPVLNITDEDLTENSRSRPVERDEWTIYSGLILQASYHRMANDIYHRTLAADTTNPENIKAYEQKINDWHNNLTFCIRQTPADRLPSWAIHARDRQMLCDRSLRLLIHRPALLDWLRRKQISPGQSELGEHLSERQCRTSGLNLARGTIRLTCRLIEDRQYSNVTLPFVLYSLFHAVLVPVIHQKADASVPESISWRQDIEEARQTLSSLSVHHDALSTHFLVILDRLTSDSAPTADGCPLRPASDPVQPSNLRNAPTNLFGNEELQLLQPDNADLTSLPTFSEWLYFPP
ncbi:uncharacterized protein BO95DRAFT_496474, partial [Aspergillus brunneoviolaceus CBS 621.78]